MALLPNIIPGFLSLSSTCSIFQMSIFLKGPVPLGESLTAAASLNSVGKHSGTTTWFYSMLLRDELPACRSKCLCLGKRSRTSPWQFHCVNQIQPRHIVKPIQFSLKEPHQNKMSFQCSKEHSEEGEAQQELLHCQRSNKQLLFTSAVRHTVQLWFKFGFINVIWIIFNRIFFKISFANPFPSCQAVIWMDLLSQGSKIYFQVELIWKETGLNTSNKKTDFPDINGTIWLLNLCKTKVP